MPLCHGFVAEEELSLPVSTYIYCKSDERPSQPLAIFRSTRSPGDVSEKSMSSCAMVPTQT